jgi:hypothetical protein
MEKIINGMLEVIEILPGKRKSVIYLAKCQCGETLKLRPCDFKKQRSCGCVKQIDLTNFIFSRLKVLSKAGVTKGCTVWTCKCSCGNITKAITAELRNGYKKSCGCLRNERVSETHRHNYGESLAKRVIDSYRNNAKTRNLNFELHHEELIKLFTKDCHYCGIKPSKTIRRKGHYGEFTYNGIDRLNNNAGYILNNVVTCCWQCNQRKRTDNDTDFLKWVKSIAIHQGWLPPQGK